MSHQGVNEMNTKVKTAASAACIEFNLDELKDNGVEVHLGLDTLSIFYPTGHNEQLSKFLDHIPRHLTNNEEADLIEAIHDTYVGLMLNRILKSVGKHSK
jgi:hypothetical protein